MSSKLIACYSIFNAEKYLRQSVLSVIDKVDKILLLDGRYEGFECPCKREHAVSCDDTETIIADLINETGRHNSKIRYTALMQTLPELAKRTLLLDLAGPNNIALIIDDDELLVGDTSDIHSRFAENQDWQVGYVRNYPSGDPWLRLIRSKPGEIQYHACGRLSYDIRWLNGDVYTVKASDPKNTNYDYRFVATGCGLRHLGDRSESRHVARIAYNNKMNREGLK